MNIFKKISVTFFLGLATKLLIAQMEVFILPFTDKFLLNPSFAGLETVSRLQISTQVTALANNDEYKQYSFTYDKYSDFLKGSIAVNLRQRFIGKVNTSVTETGFTYSTSINMNGSGNFISSINPNFLIAYKQPYVSFIDYLLDKEIEPHSPPGSDNLRSFALNPKIGLLMNMPDLQIGYTINFPIFKRLAKDLTEFEKSIMTNKSGFTFYFSTYWIRNQNGLMSKPFKIVPEAVVTSYYNNMTSRLSIKSEYVRLTYGLFWQSNFTQKHNIAGGIFCYRTGNIKLNLTSGLGYSSPLKKIICSGEISLGLFIPSVENSKFHPWSPPQKKLY